MPKKDDKPTSFADLPQLAQHVRDELGKKKFILLYAYNGTGKTRLSGAFKDLGKRFDADGEPDGHDTLYFNAFTEDLFSWDNDLLEDRHRVLRLNEQSRYFGALATTEFDTRIRTLLNRYADFEFRINTEINRENRLTRAEVVFYRDKVNDDDKDAEDPIGIKISRGEENIFIWCFFLAIVQLVLDGAEAYDWVKYIYVDDPISSLDEHNAIVVANHLIQVYREASGSNIQTVISTHHNLFFNVLHYELKNHFRGQASQYTLSRERHHNTYQLKEQTGDTPAFHHVSALIEIDKAAREERIETFHFNMLRTILEKTALFHGYTHFGKCIKKGPTDADGILHQRFVDLLSHGKYSMYEPNYMGEETRQYFRRIVREFLDRYQFNNELFPEDVIPE